MSKKLYWGLGVLFILIIGGFVFLLVQQKADLAKYEADYALPTEKVAKNENGHWHGDEWHDEPHETPNSISKRPFAEVNNLSQGGHWSDQYLPNDIETAYADDPEALKIAKCARVIRKYKDSLSPEEYSQNPEFLEAIRVKDDFYFDIHVANRFSPERHLELLKLLWPVLDTPPSNLW